MTSPNAESSSTSKSEAGQTIAPKEVVEVAGDVETIGCDGGGGALGHPMVYYSFGTKSAVDCGYCGRRFVRVGGHH